MSRFWKIVFSVYHCFFRRLVCLSNSKRAPSRELPLTALKTMFIHLKRVEFDLLLLSRHFNFLNLHVYIHPFCRKIVEFERLPFERGVTVKRPVCIILEHFSLKILSKCHSILKINHWFWSSCYDEFLRILLLIIRIFVINKFLKGKY